jgi:hypothetical protein
MQQRQHGSVEDSEGGRADAARIMRSLQHDSEKWEPVSEKIMLKQKASTRRLN